MKASIRGLRSVLFGLVPLGCALPPSEIHLPPLFSLHRTAGGGREIEALGGILGFRRDDEGSEWAIRPLLRRERTAERTRFDFLYPLGRARASREERQAYLFPLGWWRERLDEEGRPARDGAILPFFFFGRTGGGKPYFAAFPLFGTIRGFLTYDRVSFVAFPLYVENEKEGGWSTQSALWPVFAVSERKDERGFRLWPLVGWTRGGEEGRLFVLWPLFQRRRGPGEERAFLLVPLYGRSKRGDTVTTAVLWPFFGWTRNPRTGASIVEAPWPLVRVVRVARGGRLSATRVLPLFARTEGAEVSSRAYLWPLVWIRRERTDRYRRDSVYAIPVLVAWTSELADGSTEALTQVWPLFRRERIGESRETRFPALLPWPRLEGFDENLGPLVTAFSRSAAPTRLRERAWLDLWRREGDETEDRWSLAGLLARRDRRAEATVEWSFLWGLVRWRRSRDGASLLLPAFPGPGW